MPPVLLCAAAAAGWAAAGSGAGGSGGVVALRPSLRPPPLAHSACRPSIRRRCVICLDQGDGTGEGGGGSLALGSQFEEVMGALDPAERYNAVLSTLLTRGKTSPENLARASELVAEMTSKRLIMTKPSLKAFIDASVSSQEVPPILSALKTARANGACKVFGAPLTKLAPPPRKNQAPLPEIPTDDRKKEVTAALTVLVSSFFVFGLEAADFVEGLFPDFLLPGDIQSPPFFLVLVLGTAAWAYDRYTQRGRVFELILRGFGRLFDRDLQREACAESAAFLVGYILGLPCMPYTPSAARALDLLQESGAELESLLSPPARLVDRLLIWQLAPVAAELQSYDELLVSEPQIPLEMLQAARRREATVGIDSTQGGWTADDDETRVRWAFAEAKKLIQRYSGVRERLQQQMVSGVSAGECVGMVEQDLQGQWVNI